VTSDAALPTNSATAGPSGGRTVRDAPDTQMTHDPTTTDRTDPPTATTPPTRTGERPAPPAADASTGGDD
jgi:hypothetical protein